MPRTDKKNIRTIIIEKENKDQTHDNLLIASTIYVISSHTRQSVGLGWGGVGGGVEERRNRLEGTLV